MKVQIVKSGVYGDFQPSGKMGGVPRSVGDIVDYPDWYAKSLIVGGLAIEVPEIVTMTEPEVVQVESATSVETSTATSKGDVEANWTPKAQQLAAELGIDLSAIAGTGRGGRVTIKDVKLAAS